MSKNPKFTLARVLTNGEFELISNRYYVCDTDAVVDFHNTLATTVPNEAIYVVNIETGNKAIIKSTHPKPELVVVFSTTIDDKAVSRFLRPDGGMTKNFDKAYRFSSEDIAVGYVEDYIESLVDTFIRRLDDKRIQGESVHVTYLQIL